MLSQLFGHWITGQKKKFTEIRRGSWRTMSHKKKLNSLGADGEGLGEDARPAGNAGERYLIVLGAIKVGGGRK